MYIHKYNNKKQIIGFTFSLTPKLDVLQELALLCVGVLKIVFLVT